MGARWWLVLVPAIITAVASLSPVAWDYALRFGGALYYDIKESPSILDSDGSRIGVVVVHVRNNGLSTLHNVRLIVSTKVAKIIGVEPPDPQFVVNSLEKDEKSVRFEIRSLLRSDSANITFLFKASSFPFDYQMVLRSDEVVGKLLGEKNGIDGVAFGALISAGVASILSLLFVMTSKNPRFRGAFSFIEYYSDLSRSTVILFTCRKNDIDIWKYFPGHDISIIKYIDLAIVLYIDARNNIIKKDVAIRSLSFLYAFTNNPSSRDKISVMIGHLDPKIMDKVNGIVGKTDLTTFQGMENLSISLSTLVGGDPT